jgi:hypothetical protein
LAFTRARYFARRSQVRADPFFHYGIIGGGAASDGSDGKY